jgi:hypothetical protein
MQNKRKVEADKNRSQRAQLQHEVDILNQKVTQDIAALKEEMRGSLDDRRMVVRIDQNQRENQVSNNAGDTTLKLS